ncbi:hypothetical protein KJR81_08675, partial [Klebsiella pneumoniae]
FGLAENTYDLFVGKTLLHGDVLMWLMKTLLTSRCINQRGAGQDAYTYKPKKAPARKQGQAMSELFLLVKHHPAVDQQ